MLYFGIGGDPASTVSAYAISTSTFLGSYRLGAIDGDISAIVGAGSYIAVLSTGGTLALLRASSPVLTPPTPAITSVLNAASPAPGPFAPGSLITIRGLHWQTGLTRRQHRLHSHSASETLLCPNSISRILRQRKRLLAICEPYADQCADFCVSLARTSNTNFERRGPLHTDSDCHRSDGSRSVHVERNANGLEPGRNS